MKKYLNDIGWLSDLSQLKESFDTIVSRTPACEITPMLHDGQTAISSCTDGRTSGIMRTLLMLLVQKSSYTVSLERSHYRIGDGCTACTPLSRGQPTSQG